jgi:hypothetical protein
MKHSYFMYSEGEPQSDEVSRLSHDRAEVMVFLSYLGISSFSLSSPDGVADTLHTALRI